MLTVLAERLSESWEGCLAADPGLLVAMYVYMYIRARKHVLL